MHCYSCRCYGQPFCKGYGPLAYAWLEQWTHNPLVRGSTPRGPTKYMNELNKLVELAQQVECEDPIDWGMLQVDENEAYLLLANGLVEHFGLPETERELLLLVTLLKTTAENFTLNLKLLGDPR